MSTLFLYADLSPSWPWIFATLQENESLLKDNGIVFAEFDKYTGEVLFSHNKYFSYSLKKNKNTLPYLEKWQESVQNQLDSGQNVLLMTNVVNEAAHMGMTDWLQGMVNFSSQNIKILIRIGNPALVFEQRLRRKSSAMRGADILRVARRHTSYIRLIEEMEKAWGKECLTLLADLSDSSVASRDEKLSADIFEWLGCPHPKSPTHTPRHPFFLKSWEGRRLSLTAEVRWNSYPPMDDSIFMDCLCLVEKEWDKDPVCPLKYRKIFLEESSENVRALEKRLHLAENSFACPDWFTIRPSVTLGQPLSYEKVSAFASALPKREREALVKRLSNDRMLLSNDQKILFEALIGVSNQASYISDANPLPTITVLTMTYNHERYIGDCIKGVLAQKTKFPVKHLILDHHSEDNTPSIIRIYAEKYPSIYPVLLSRHVDFENIYGLFSRCRTTYAAICDGDDYFTNPLKLQKQVTYLEENKDCALCAHPVLVAFENKEQENYVYPPVEILSEGFDAKYPIEQLLKGNFIQPNSAVYRWRFTDGLPSWFRYDLIPEDWYIHLLHAEIGKIGMMHEIMSVYRRHHTAMFYSGHVSKVEHRKKYGMGELTMYKVINEHFNGKYFKEIAIIANEVFVNFLLLNNDEEKNKAFSSAINKFPDFGRFFLDSVKKTQRAILESDHSLLITKSISEPYKEM